MSTSSKPLQISVTSFLRIRLLFSVAFLFFGGFRRGRSFAFVLVLPMLRWRPLEYDVKTWVGRLRTAAKTFLIRKIFAAHCGGLYVWLLLRGIRELNAPSPYTLLMMIIVILWTATYLVFLKINQPMWHFMNYKVCKDETKPNKNLLHFLQAHNKKFIIGHCGQNYYHGNNFSTKTFYN